MDISRHGEKKEIDLFVSEDITRKRRWVACATTDLHLITNARTDRCKYTSKYFLSKKYTIQYFLLELHNTAELMENSTPYVNVNIHNSASPATISFSQIIENSYVTPNSRWINENSAICANANDHVSNSYVTKSSWINEKLTSRANANTCDLASYVNVNSNRIKRSNMTPLHR
jgi:hypothetical protein